MIASRPTALSAHSTPSATTPRYTSTPRTSASSPRAGRRSTSQTHSAARRKLEPCNKSHGTAGPRLPSLPSQRSTTEKGKGGREDVGGEGWSVAWVLDDLDERPPLRPLSRCVIWPPLQPPRRDSVMRGSQWPRQFQSLAGHMEEAHAGRKRDGQECCVQSAGWRALEATEPLSYYTTISTTGCNLRSMSRLRPDWVNTSCSYPLL